MEVRVGDEVVFEREKGAYILKKLSTMELDDFVGVIKSKDRIKAVGLQHKWREEFKKREDKLKISA